MAAINKFMSQIQLSKLNTGQSKIQALPKSLIDLPEKSNEKLFVNVAGNNDSYFHFS